MKRFAILTIAVLLLFIALPVRSKEIKKDFRETFDVRKGFRLRINHGDGDVVIKPWDKDVLEVTIIYDADYKALGLGGDVEFEAEFRERDGLIHVIGKEKFPKAFGLHFFKRYEHRYTVNAPSYLELETHGDDGDVHIEGWSGAIECLLDDGEVSLTNISSPLTNVRCEDGDLVVEKLTGALSFKGDDGDVFISDSVTPKCRINIEDGDLRIKRCEGNFRIEVGDGRVDLSRVSAKKLKVSSDDGDLNIDALKEDDIEFDISTDDGDITVELEPGMSVHFTIDTDDGRMTVDLPAAENIEKGRHWISGEIHGGRGRIRIRTADGRVELRESKR